MSPRSPLPRPVFTKAERAVIDAESRVLKLAFREAGMPERRDGFPFRQYRNLTVRTLVRSAPRDAWVRNWEHAGLLLSFAREREEPLLYVRIPYAVMLPTLIASGSVDADRLPPDTFGHLTAAIPAAAAFVEYGRARLAAAHEDVST